MEGKIKHLSVNAPKATYNLINKCFNFNLSYDDKCDKLFTWNYHLQGLNPGNKLYYRLLVGELSYLIPELNKTVVVIPGCEYKFIKEDGTKIMEINGKSLHVLGENEENTLIKPIQFSEKNGL